MQGLLKASDLLGGIADRLGRIAAWLFLPLMLVIVYDICQRKLLGWYPEFQQSELYRFLPSTKLQELEWHIHAFLFLLCLGFTYVRNGHVRVELVRDSLKPRTRAWIELLGCLFFLLPYCAIVGWFAYGDFVKAWEINESSSAMTGLPWRWIVKGCLPVGFFFLGLAGLSVLLRHVVYLFGPDRLKSAAGHFVEVREIESLRQEVEQELASHGHEPGAEGPSGHDKDKAP